MNDIPKNLCGVIIIGIVALLQCIAWYLGKNGTVFALTSFVIGGIAGYIFGFKQKEPEK